jgi:Lon protease-like protein
MLTEGQETGEAAITTQQVGTICEVHTAEQLPDGRWVVLAVGGERGALGQVDRSGPYATVEVTPLPDEAGDGAAELLPDVQVALDAYLETVKRFAVRAASESDQTPGRTDVAASLDEVLKPIQLPPDPSAASYAVGGVLQIELTRKQQLLELPDAASRLRAELDLLRRESRLLANSAMPPLASTGLDYNRN